MMLGALVFSILLPVTVACRSQGGEGGWREAMVRAALVWGAGILVVTEVLGAFKAFRFWPVFSFWIAAHVVALVLARSKAWPRLRLRFSVGAVGLAGFLLLTLTVALLAPPNTADVLSYHLPRQLLWLQQGSVEHFLTVNDRALMMPPLAEMIQAHTLLLSGGDHWVNLPQWCAYIFGAVVVSLLARELGGSGRTQRAAAWIFVTLPMAYHQAASAKNDLLVAVWLGMFAWVTLRIAMRADESRSASVAAGAALGLAFATKTTAFIFGLPVGLMLLWSARRAPGRLVLVGGVALLLASPHWIRNQLWYGTPLGEHLAMDGGAQANEICTPRSVLSNLTRAATLHLASPVPRVNRALHDGVARMHTWLGQDLNDRRTTLWVLRYGVSWHPGDEVLAGAPAQFLLGLAALLLWLWRGPRTGPVAWVSALVVLGAVICGAVLKWQPFGARLQLPGFLLLAPLMAVIAAQVHRHAITFVSIVCLLGWWPSRETIYRPLVSAPTLWSANRWENYFRFDPSERVWQEAIAHTLKTAEIRSLQIVTRHGFPYPLMRQYLADNGPDAKFWGELPGALKHPPDGVLILGSDPRPLFLRPGNATERFEAIGQTDPYLFYVPASRARQLLTQLPRPGFLGWDKADGLVWTETKATPVKEASRILTGSDVRLSFPVGKPRMRVRLGFNHTTSDPQSIVVELDGQTHRVFSAPPGETRHVEEFVFAPAAERAELRVRAPAGVPLQFWTLQILEE
jgi:4-amino-4-deoxy-L-arabinose transferase-like glycosyltransferase